ncbi:zinc-binding dehydrogenase [Nocardia takedensis]
MRTITARGFGPPDVLELREVPDPTPGEGRVTVAVAAAPVNWLDTRIRAGLAQDIFPVDPPYVPGWSVAGTVRALGPEVPRSLLGTRVVTRTCGDYGDGYADTALADVGDLTPVPPDLDLETAAALIDDGSTALALLERTPVGPGDRVLILPGLGGLGHLAVQLARAAGAFVIAGVRGEAKLEAARSLADAVVDYDDHRWTAAVGDLGGVHVVFDGVGGALGAAAADLLVDGGRFSGYGMAGGAPTTVTEAVARGLSVADMSQLPEFWPDNARRVAAVLDLAAAGGLVTTIGRVHPLARAADAHADIEHRRMTGKILLRP